MKQNKRFPDPLLLIGWFYAGFTVLIPVAKLQKGDPWYQIEMTATMGVAGAVIFFGLSLAVKCLLRRRGNV